MYLKLDIHPANIDVNVHPTKREVKFLDEALIIDHIQGCLDALLQGALLASKSGCLRCRAISERKFRRDTGGNESRTFYTQMLLTGVDAAAVRQSQQEQKEADGEDNEKQDGGAQCNRSLAEEVLLRRYHCVGHDRSGVRQSCQENARGRSATGWCNRGVHYNWISWRTLQAAKRPWADRSRHATAHRKRGRRRTK